MLASNPGPFNCIDATKQIILETHSFLKLQERWTQFHNLSLVSSFIRRHQGHPEFYLFGNVQNLFRTKL